MCFYIDNNHPEIKIAEQDIVCYKEGYTIIEVFISLYREFRYFFNQLYQTQFRNCEIEEKHIYEGFHSYTNLSLLSGFNSYCNDNISVKCIIPKGTKYFVNTLHTEYVSEAIIIVEEIKM